MKGCENKMKVFIVTYKTEEKEEFMSRTCDDLALSDAVSFASSNKYRLVKVLEVNTETNSVVELELELIEGRFELVAVGPYRSVWTPASHRDYKGGEISG